MLKALGLTLLGASAMVLLSLIIRGGVADDVCGPGTRLVWLRLTLPHGNAIWALGDAQRPLFNCLKTLNHANHAVEIGVPRVVADVLATAPFPGTLERCEALRSAFPAVEHSSYYWTMWWSANDAQDIADRLCV